ncbi:hypothetical protein MVEN_00130400 [Mycena venus]|uniref:Uncharacterized protein n=1 Tax=Mycena venus TaxID=2733690 RepID=A0A8H7DIL3_9AGAR|nr:hypothetical protein MVEN_00130400 [Mycena venus]
MDILETSPDTVSRFNIYGQAQLPAESMHPLCIGTRGHSIAGSDLVINISSSGGNRRGGLDLARVQPRGGVGKKCLDGDEDGIEARGVDHAVFDRAEGGARVNKSLKGIE